jgi:hypothetical protein
MTVLRKQSQNGEADYWKSGDREQRQAQTTHSQVVEGGGRDEMTQINETWGCNKEMRDEVGAVLGAASESTLERG